MTTDEMITKLKADVDKLHALLADPQPGLMTWNMFVGERCKSIAELWHGKQRLTCDHEYNYAVYPAGKCKKCGACD